jgi:hypothetical protein
LTTCQACILDRFREIADVEKTGGSQGTKTHDGYWYYEGGWKNNVIVGTPKPVPKINEVVERDQSAAMMSIPIAR